MQSVDGDVRLSVKLDTKDAGKDAVKMGSEITRALNRSDMKARQLENTLLKAAEKLELAKTKLQEFTEKSNEPTQEFTNLQKEITDTISKEEKLIDQLKEWESIGLGSTQAFKDTEAEADKLVQKIEELKRKQSELETSGKAFATADTASSSYQKLADNVAQAEREFELANDKLKAYNEQSRKSEQQTNKFKTVLASTYTIINKFASTMQQAGKAVGGTLLTGLKKIGSVANSAAKSLGTRLSNSIKKLTSSFLKLHVANRKASSGFNLSLKTLLKYGLGIRSLYALVNRLRGALQEGFQNLARYDSTVNKNISEVVSTLAQLKNGLATAFAPLVEVAFPVLDQLLQYLAQALNFLAQLGAAMSGKTTYTKAVKVQKQYADSLEETAKEAKEASTYLSGLDEITRYQTQSTEESEDSGIADMFETEEIETPIQHLAETIKDMFNDIFDAFKQAWDEKGQAVIDAFKGALQAIKDLLLDIGKTFRDIWNNGSGVDLIKSILGLLESVLNLIHAIADAFRRAWDKYGYEIVQLIFDVLTNIFNLLKSIADTFAKVFESDVGTAYMESLLNLFRAWLNLINSIVLAIQQVWDERGLEFVQKLLTTFTDINNLVASILDTFARIFQESTGIDFLNSIFDVLEAILDIIDSITIAFQQAWDAYGYELVKSIFEMLTAINELLVTIGETFATVFSNGTGAEIIGHILQIFTNINDTISAIATNLQEVWDNTGLGEQIVQTILDIFDGIAECIDNISASTKKWAENLDFTELLESIKNLLDSVKGFLEPVENGLGDIWNNVLLPLGKWTIEKAIPTTLNLIANALKLIKEFGQSAWDNVLEPLWNNFLEPAIGFAADAFITTIETLSKVLKDVSENETAVGVLVGVATAIVSIKTAVAAWEGAQKLLNIALNMSPISAVTLAISGLITIIVLCITYWDEIKEALSNAWEAIKETWGTVKDWFSEHVGKPIKNVLDSISQAFTDFKDTIAKIWEGLKDVIKNPINNIIGFINSFISGLTSGLNSVIDALNAFHIDLPDWLGGKSFGFNIQHIRAPQIPYLAQGAVIPPNKPFAAILGDQSSGTNIETPLSTMIEAFTKALDSRGMENNSSSYRFTAQINRRTIFDEIIEEARIRQSASGRNPFELA